MILLCENRFLKISSYSNTYVRKIYCLQTNYRIYLRDIVKSHVQRERRRGARCRERKESSPLLRPSQLCHSHARFVAPRFARHSKQRACVITTWARFLKDRLALIQD